LLLSRAILADVAAAISDWPRFATEAGIRAADAAKIERTFRRDLMV
jgi:hypothetical protein